MMKKEEAQYYVVLTKKYASENGIPEELAYNIYVKPIVEHNLKLARYKKIMESEPYLVANNNAFLRDLIKLEGTGIREVTILDEDVYQAIVAEEIVDEFLNIN